MLKIGFNNTDAVAVENMRKRGPKIIAALAQRLTLLMFKLQRKIQTEKLQGQVLHHRSGKLFGSIHATPAKVEGTKLVGQVSGAGGPAWYGQVHENGGTRAYVILPVNKKALKFVMGGKDIFAKRVNHPPLPQRSFMASSLAEMREEIITSVQQTAREASL